MQSNKTNKNIVCANSQLIDNKERATKMLLAAINEKYESFLLSYLLATFSEVKLVYVPVFGALYLPSAMFWINLSGTTFPAAVAPPDLRLSKPKLPSSKPTFSKFPSKISLALVYDSFLLLLDLQPDLV